MKIHGYALVNQDGHYLLFEQESNHDLSTYTTNEERHAHLFKTIDDAEKVAKGFNTGEKVDGLFMYWGMDYDKPYAVVEVTILSHGEEVKRLIID